jgi:hypothetical protein
MIEKHLDESKQILLDTINRILLNEEEKNTYKNPFRGISDNIQLTSIVIEAANERISDFSTYTGDSEEIELYEKELIVFLRDNLKNRI